MNGVARDIMKRDTWIVKALSTLFNEWCCKGYYEERYLIGKALSKLCNFGVFER